MSKLIIHVGTHKTATTFIQDTLALNAYVLAQNNIIFPKVGKFAGHHSLVTEWVEMAPAYSLEGGYEKVWNKLIDSYANTDKTVVLSSEEFSRFSPTHVDMRELRKRVSAFDSVEIVCTLKDQMKFLQSIYLEISKRRTPASLMNWLANAHQTNLADGLLLDYDRLYEHFLTGFKPEEIKFLSFDQITRSSGVLNTFLEVIGYEGDRDAIQEIEKPVNVSGEPLSVWIYNIINAPKPIQPRIIVMIERALSSHLPSHKPRSLFTEIEIEKMAAQFNPANEKFVKRIRRQQPEFNLPSIKKVTDSAFRSEVNQPFWIKLLREHY